MSFRLVPNSVTLDDLEQRNGRYIALFHFRKHTFQHITATSICGRIYARVFYFVVRVQCRRKKVHVRYLIS